MSMQNVNSVTGLSPRLLSTTTLSAYKHNLPFTGLNGDSMRIIGEINAGYDWGDVDLLIEINGITSQSVYKGTRIAHYNNTASNSVVSSSATANTIAKIVGDNGGVVSKLLVDIHIQNNATLNYVHILSRTTTFGGVNYGQESYGVVLTSSSVKYISSVALQCYGGREYLGPGSMFKVYLLP